MKQNIIILLLVCLVFIQLAIMKHMHDNSYRLSSIVKHSANTSNDINYILNFGLNIKENNWNLIALFLR